MTAIPRRQDTALRALRERSPVSLMRGSIFFHAQKSAHQFRSLLQSLKLFRISPIESQELSQAEIATGMRKLATSRGPGVPQAMFRLCTSAAGGHFRRLRAFPRQSSGPCPSFVPAGWTVPLQPENNRRPIRRFGVRSWPSSREVACSSGQPQ
jgi:hypothetical protein